MSVTANRLFRIAFTGAATSLLMACGVRLAINIPTYHNDTLRTGWNNSEIVLTPSNVNSSSFGLVAAALLDDQVDTQPLLISDSSVAAAYKTQNPIVFVATEGNSVFAIDSITGKILLSQKFGTPVPSSFVSCDNNGANIGIDSTPTIDSINEIMYFIAYVISADGKTASHQLHAISLLTLQDIQGSPIAISAALHLNDTNETLVNFNSNVARQRPALLLLPTPPTSPAGQATTPTLYAAFGSYCDNSAGDPRGWVFSFQLTPSGAFSGGGSVFLTNSQGGSQQHLSSVWMSGYGIAGDPNANTIFFTTGNSAGHTFNASTNLTESAVQLTNQLNFKDEFTPANVDFLNGNRWTFIVNEGSNDLDFGSGGIMLLPDQQGSTPHLAVAAGKDGRMWILNRDQMGGFETGPKGADAPTFVQIGPCWCGPSYFETTNGHFVVSSGGGVDRFGNENIPHQVQLWSVPGFTNIASATLPEDSQQDGGFFTTVSSLGTNPNTSIIWAVGRAFGDDNHVTLFAFKGNPSGQTLPLLYQQAAGFWDAPGNNSNANIVPTVGNGRVFVASDGLLEIFSVCNGTGLPACNAVTAQVQEHHLKIAASRPKYSGPEYWGTLLELTEETISITLRDGHSAKMDVRTLRREGHIPELAPGEPVHVKFKTGPNGAMLAQNVARAKGKRTWGVDRNAEIQSK